MPPLSTSCPVEVGRPCSAWVRPRSPLCSELLLLSFPCACQRCQPSTVPRCCSHAIPTLALHEAHTGRKTTCSGATTGLNAVPSRWGILVHIYPQLLQKQQAAGKECLKKLPKTTIVLSSHSRRNCCPVEALISETCPRSPPLRFRHEVGALGERKGVLLDFDLRPWADGCNSACMQGLGCVDQLPRAG